MNFLVLLTWLKDNWRLVLFLVMLALFAVQSYRLRGAQAEVSVLKVEEKERMKRDALRAAQNLRNKERTDEEYATARRRAVAFRVRSNPGGIIARAIDVAAGSNESTVCFGRGKLDEELTDFARRTAERLEELLQRNAERLSAVAQQGEELASAYRACRTYTLNISDAPGKGGDDADVGGISAASPLPVLRSLR